MIAGVPLAVYLGAMEVNVTIRELHDMQDLSATVELQRVVWQMRAHECSSPHTMKAATHTGGCVLGAEADGRMIGFCFGMAGRREGEIWLWSHMTAVHPDYQSGGIGFALKQAQREWALAHDYRVMAWTFDPLQAGNANFNFNRLGVTARHYAVNHYGEMQDGLNAGLASDRLEAHWQLDDARVIALARGSRPNTIGLPTVDEKLVYLIDENELCRARPVSYGDACYGIEIPLNIARLKQTNLVRAQTWQIYVREAITSLLDAGYRVVGFDRAGSVGRYVMRRADSRKKD